MRLYRSTDNKKIAGILGGLGEIYSIDPTILRLIYLFIILLGIFSWVIPAVPFVLAYLAAWIVIPKGRTIPPGAPVSKPVSETSSEESKKDTPSA